MVPKEGQKMSQIVEALRPRAQLVAEILGSRIPNAGSWSGYRRDEPLKGVLQTADTVRWTRIGYDDQSMTFGFLKVLDISAQQAGEDRIISSDVVERHEHLYKFDKPIKYTETLSHTFSKTTSVEEAAKQAWEVAAKVNFSVTYSGVSGGIEASAKYGQELARKSSEAVTESDTVTKTLEIQGPVEFRWVAERSTDTIVRSYDAVPDLDFKLYFQGKSSGWEWASFADVFIPAAGGNAPVDQSYSIFASSSDSHDLFDRFPVGGEDLQALESELADSIPFTAKFQTVNRQSIKAI